MVRRLEAKQLVKTYCQNEVVNRVCLNVCEGEVVGLLGPNGAGKTTTFYMLVGLIKPDSGDIFLDSKNVTHLPMYRRAREGIGYLPQESSVFSKLTVEDNIMAILETLPLSRVEQGKRKQELLQELRISHLAKQKAYTLSGGERRRTEIARAMVTSPSFLLLDEPFTGIDPIVLSDIQQIVSNLKNKGFGVLITDHNVRETLKITDRAYIMSEGKILLAGTGEELACNPEARRVYLGKDFVL